MILSLFYFVFRFDTLDDSNCSHEAREESYASSMDNKGGEFVLSTGDFDTLMGPGVDETTYFQNLNFVLHHMLRAIWRVQPTLPPLPPVVLQKTPIERFCKCKAEDFYGTSEDDLIAAGQWLRDTLRTLRPLRFTPESNLEKYIGQAHMDDLRMQFSRLVQDRSEVFLELVQKANTVEKVLVAGDIPGNVIRGLEPVSNVGPSSIFSRDYPKTSSASPTQTQISAPSFQYGRRSTHGGDNVIFGQQSRGTVRFVVVYDI
ncbi:hypothetical protein GOBAR_AA10075 [Gossypium barbadense]|uniref:Uncharacterized protein n=1 Tax=Gossypium barbadense TaxID=3634 RepID=A0A2P5Y4Q2_GOSBA|nr:hypothetical protein GOBAR_AA10075 [Gossypium barbadense]